MTLGCPTSSQPSCTHAGFPYLRLCCEGSWALSSPLRRGGTELGKRGAPCPTVVVGEEAGIPPAESQE